MPESPATRASAIWPAPAKINLFLHIIGKRSDGYHNLQTVFQLLDYGDELSFTLNNTGEINRAYDFGFDQHSDLCLRAAGLLQEYASDDSGVTIGLHKRLPIGAGLGGGSSDAATVLLALNRLWDLRLARSQLATIALQLGADVPVFVRGRSAWAEGVGERLTPLELDERWYLVVIPQIYVSTAMVFSHKHLTARSQMMKIRAFQEARQLHFGENQLEPLVRAAYPEVDELIRWLCKFGEPRMSGSGGAVFMPLISQHQGLELLANRPSKSIGFVAKGINCHPLYQA